MPAASCQADHTHCIAVRPKRAVGRKRPFPVLPSRHPRSVRRDYPGSCLGRTQQGSYSFCTPPAERGTCMASAQVLYGAVLRSHITRPSRSSYRGGHGSRMRHPGPVLPLAAVHASTPSHLTGLLSPTALGQQAPCPSSSAASFD